MPRRGENIRKRKDGRWEGRYAVYNDNVKHYKSVYAKTYQEVREKLFQARMKSISGMEEQEEKAEYITFNKVADEWLLDVHKKYKFSTFVKYQNIYVKHIKGVYGELSLCDIRTEILVDKIPAKSSSVTSSIYCVLNQIITYGNIHYKTPQIILEKQKYQKKTDPIKILSKSEQSRLLQVLLDRTSLSKMGIYLCLTTGIRLGELCALRWSDIDWSTRTLYIRRSVQRVPDNGSGNRTRLLEQEPKTLCSKREIPLSNQIFQMLENFRNDDSIYIFNKDKPLDPRTFQARFKKYLKEAGLEQTNFHILRHSFATNCIECGADVKSVSEILGHSDVKITLNRYVHPAFETKCGYINSLETIYGQLIGQPLD